MRIDPAEARAYRRASITPASRALIDYLNIAMDRLTVTLGLLPETDHPLRVLELGAFPYFMTALMLKHAPQFPAHPDQRAGRRKEDVLDTRGHIRNPDNGIDYPVEYEEFNIDTDPFPTPMTASTWSSTARSSST